MLVVTSVRQWLVCFRNYRGPQCTIVNLRLVNRSSYREEMRLFDSKAVTQMEIKKLFFASQSAVTSILRTRLDTWGLQSSHTVATYSGRTQIAATVKFSILFLLTGALRNLMALVTVQFFITIIFLILILSFRLVKRNMFSRDYQLSMNARRTTQRLLNRREETLFL